MHIAMIGTGYVGLTTGACLADLGIHVTCVDQDKEKIAALRKGIISFYEPGLQELVHQTQKQGSLNFSDNMSSAIKGVDAIFIAVGTPSFPNGGADLSDVMRVIHQLCESLSHNPLIVTKSTVPTGTNHHILSILKEKRPDLDWHIASNPEFLREGSAIDDFVNPDRIIVGADSEEAHLLMRAIYQPFYAKDCPVVHTDILSSELIKYTANVFLAARLAFINQIADLCEKVGADIQHVAYGSGLDHRIGTHYLHAGPGYGGSCFPKDTRALLAMGEAHGVDLSIANAVNNANELRKTQMSERVIQACGGSVKGLRIAILGISFKANTDDLRESVSCWVIPTLLSAGAEIVVYDPASGKVGERVFPVSFKPNLLEALEGVHAAVILTEWPQFGAINFEEALNVMKRPLLIDLRNMYRRSFMEDTFFEYHSIGRQPVIPQKS